MLASSLKGQQALLDNSFVPAHPTLDNFVAVFGRQNNFGYAIRNSMVIATTTTAIALLFGISTSYALARLRFRARPVVLGAMLLASMFPGSLC
jgi:multiple sugar transport system permease protein